MSIQIANISLVGAVVGQTGFIPASGVLPNPPPNALQQMRPDAGNLALVVVYNESPCVLLLSLPNSNQSITLPAGRWIPIPIPATETQLKYTVQAVATGTILFNSLLADYYNPGEPVESLGVLGNSPIGGSISLPNIYQLFDPDNTRNVQVDHGTFIGIPGSQIRLKAVAPSGAWGLAFAIQNIAASPVPAMGFDTNTNAYLNGSIAELAGITLVGRGVVILPALTLDTAVTVTTAVNILTYTPAAGGQFRVSADFTLNNAGTVTLKVTFNNRNGTATTLFMTAGTTSLNAAALVAGTYAASTIAFTAGAAAITVVFQDTTAGPTDHVTASLEWIQ